MKNKQLIKTFAFCMLVCASVQAEEAVKVTVFSKDIHLPSDCRLIASPSVLDGNIFYSCDDMSVYFKKAGEIDKEYLLRHANIVSVDDDVIEGKRHYLLQTKYGKESPMIYVLCDEELCISVHASDDSHIDDLVLQISKKRLHNKQLNWDGAKSAPPVS